MHSTNRLFSEHINEILIFWSYKGGGFLVILIKNRMLIGIYWFGNKGIIESECVSIVWNIDIVAALGTDYGLYQ